MKPNFVHLHVHSTYSLLDGMSDIQGLIDQAYAYEMPAVALTDHGNMFGVKMFLDYSAKKRRDIDGKIKETKEKFAEKKNPTETERQELELEILRLERLKVKPIVGCEVYITRGKYTSKDKNNPDDTKRYHLLLLAKNLKGYHNLAKLVSMSYLDGFYYRPRIDHEILAQHSEGLICSSACLGGEIHKLIEKNDLEEAEKAVLWHKKVFGDDYYLELQRHETHEDNANQETFVKQTEQNKILIELARKTDTKLIATNDVHFLKEHHAEAHEHLICLGTGRDLDDPKRMLYSKQEWFKSYKEMAEIFSDIPEALSNTLEIADKIEIYNINSSPMMPYFEIPEAFGTEASFREKYSEEMLRKEFGNTDEKGVAAFDRLGGYKKIIRIKLEAEYLKKLTYEGAYKRYGKELSESIIERIEFELNVMKTMGFPGYFLIVEDFIRQARNMDISVGPGRGSAAGSVVAYCLWITDIDPLKYDLLFERFLNPDRISMPDIDIDFEDDKRGQIIRWVTEKYGKERVANIITYQSMKARSSIKDVARVQQLPLKEAIRLTKLIPDHMPKDPKGKEYKPTLSNCLQHVEAMKEEQYSSNNLITSTLRNAEILEGTIRQAGVHACGLIIGPDDLINIVPLSTAKDKDTKEDKVVTQYEGKTIEDVGLIKMDFLGLKTLSVIKDAIKNVKLSKNIDIDIDAISIDDEITYKLFSEGGTVGVFQFESAGMQKYLKELKPTRFEDLIAMNALYRPGPMDYIPQFVNRKHGLEPIEYPFPQMEKRLKETYGITVYQEQVMLLSRDIANFTRGESDKLRKAMGKKDEATMQSLKQKFLNGATENGYAPREKLEKIWSDWAKFASYAFNKSHATCYSWIAYQTAYLKAHYPAEYMAANLTRNKDNITDVSKFLDECKRMKLNVLYPDVNVSYLNFTVDDSDNIRYGLGAIRGVGEGAVEAIVECRESGGKFKDIYDFVERVNLRACNKKAIEGLAYAGAFEGLDNISREQLCLEDEFGNSTIDRLVKYGTQRQQDTLQNSNSLFGDTIDTAVEISKPNIPYAKEWSTLNRLNKEKEMIGIYLSAHPMDEYKFERAHFCNANTKMLGQIETQPIGRILTLAGIITEHRKGISKKGDPYGMFTIEDDFGSHKIPLFGNNYVSYGKYLIQDMFVFLRGTAHIKGSNYKYNNQRKDEPAVIEFKLIDMMPMTKVRDSISQIIISLNLEKLDVNTIKFFTEEIEKHRQKGKVNVHINIVDLIHNESLHTLSRSHLIKLTPQLFHYLEEATKERVLEYTLVSNLR